uniref:Uncharacterized protein n=1 Tax=Anguilla anguilla TaxID=7936 RepID=A0A0E9Q464_ANGAN
MVFMINICICLMAKHTVHSELPIAKQQ